MSPRGPTLSDFVAADHHFARSINLERDSEVSTLAGYLPTARALETMRRVAAAVADPSLTRAWSITGPYGSGKSSLALLLDTLAGPQGQARQDGLRIVAGVDEETSSAIDAALGRLAGPTGLVRAVATAQREPAARTIVRAVVNGLRRYPGHERRQRSMLAEAEHLLSAVPLSARAVADLVQNVASLAPVLLILDEFGKNLEFFADRSDDADLFVLQEIAERANGPSAMPVYFLTLQHLAFEEYATTTTALQRREWAKVQGRFEDIPFVDSHGELLQLVARVLRRSDACDVAFTRTVQRWARTEHRRLSELPVGERLPSPEVVEACYPLHPVALAVLPELCSRYGQRERTLFSFLARPEPHSLTSFLVETPVVRRRPPSLGVDGLFDYFISTGSTAMASSDGASRWLEIDARIRETQGLSDDEQRIIKTIGVLNLVSRGGSLRASRSLLEHLFPDVDVVGALKRLETRGLLVHRTFADEYRIWQGSDFDVQGAVGEARRALAAQAATAICERALPLTPLVASRHSQDKGVLRFFSRCYASAGTRLRAPAAADKADGLLAYVVDGTPPEELSFDPGESRKPVLLVYPAVSAGLVSSALDAAAVVEVMAANETIGTDWVARRELHERAGVATALFRNALETGFDLDLAQTRVMWTDGTIVERPGRRTWSGVLSDVCDTVYRSTPTIANEMLARRELSSQAARARRDLLAAMVQSRGLPQLGIVGYGPERAMLESVLVHSGIYRPQSLGRWAFGPPWASSGYGPAWEALDQCLTAARTRQVCVKEMWESLAVAPIGLPDGPIPVLVTAVLLAHADDIAVYQDGTFQAAIGPELVERLVKAPDRFAIKHFSATGPRRRVLAALAEQLASPLVADPGTIPTPIQVLRPIIRRVRALPDYAKHTANVSETAQQVRKALLTATEPDELLFAFLPQAVGMRPFRPSAKISEESASAFAALVAKALRDLERAYPKLLTALVRVLGTGVGRPPVAGIDEMRSELGARARGIADRVLEPRLRSFLLAAGDTSLDDEDWLQNLAMNVSGRPAHSWRDDDRRRFDTDVRELLAAYRRVEMLHLEQLDAPGTGMIVRQVMVTSPDGHRSGGVVWLDQGAAAEMSDIAATALAAAESRVGARAAEALLAVIADALDQSVAQKATPLRTADGPTATDEARGLANG